MPQYLIPSNRATFVHQFAKDEQQAEFIIKKLGEFLDSPEPLKKKSFSGRIVYTLNIDYGRHKHRALFELTTIDERPVYALRSLAWMHDYNAALNWQSLGPINSQNIPQEYQLAQEKAASFAVSSVEHEQQMVYFKAQWHEPTAFQSQILADTHFPQLLIGAPGSGKTFILTALMQEQAWNLQKILYITGNPALSSAQKKEWSALEKKGALHQASAQVVFLSFTQFYTWYCDEVSNDKLLNEEELLSRLTKALPKDSASQVLAELKLNSWQLHQDVAEHNAYDKSRYRHSGINKSLYSEQDKERLYEVLTKMLQTMKERHEFYPGVSKVEVMPEEYSFDLIAVDESQNQTPQDLLNITLFSKNQHIVLAGDSLQKGGTKLSSLPIIGNALHQQFHASLKAHQLPVSLRLMPASARLANNLVLLYTNLRQGRADSTAYSSILSPQGGDLEAPAAEDFVHLISQDRLSELKNIGANAHAAAIVLTDEDKGKARQYTNSANVFTHTEAQGLEFSHVFFYLSQESLARFIRVSEAMKQLGITAETTLKEYLHNPSQKGIVDGEQFELLSHLLVGLTRSCGSNWIYYEPVEGELQRKLQPFLPWFNRVIGLTPENKQVKPTISSPQEWLTVINRFISEGALVQARDNLRLILKLQAHEADAYIALYPKGELKESLAALEDWRTQASMPSASSSSPPANATSSPASTSAKATAAKPFSFSAKQGQWIEQLYQSIDSEKNVNALINHKLSAPILFEYKLAATQKCLLVSLFLHKKADEGLAEAFLTHFKKLLTQKKAYAELMNAGYLIAKKNNDYWLMLCLCSLANHFSKLNTLITTKQLNELRSLAQQHLGQLAPQRLEEVDTTILDTICRPGFLDNQTLAALATPFKNEHGNVGYSFLFWIILNIDCYPEFLHQQKIISLIIESIDLNITMKNMLLFALLHTSTGRKYIHQYFELIKKRLNDKNLFVQFTDGEHQGTSPFMLLCLTPEGSFLIIEQWAFFSALIEKNPLGLFSPITEDGPDKGKSAFYFLCYNPAGQALVILHWAFFSALLIKYPQALFAQATESKLKKGASPFYYLCESPEGQSLIITHWDFFSALITQYPHGLFAPATGDGADQGATPFYYLCDATIKGHLLIMEHWAFFSALLIKYPQALFAPITGKGPNEGKNAFYFLCGSPLGRTLIIREWAFFKTLIANNPLGLFTQIKGTGPDQGKSAFYFLCGSAEGQDLIIREWDFFKTLIANNPQGLFAQVTEYGPNQGKSAFYYLCGTPKGQSLIVKHWDFFSVLIAKYPHTLFAPITADGPHKGTSAFYLLFQCPTGLSLIINQWAFFSALIANNPQGLFAQVTGNAPDKGKNAFYYLCDSAVGQSLIVREWAFFEKFIAIEQLKQYPNGKKLAAEINQDHRLARTIGFFSAEANASQATGSPPASKLCSPG